MRNFLIVAHKYLPQPDDDLVTFLIHKKKDNVIHIMHSFPEAKDRKSLFLWHRNGKIYKKLSSPDFINFPEIILYLKELLYTLRWSCAFGEKIDLYVGMDGMCCMFGLILQKIGIVKKVVYWCIDFVPERRFKQSWKNRIYDFVNTVAIKNSDEVWDLSPRMIAGRQKFLKIRKKEYKFHRIVPYGVWSDKIKHHSYESSEKYTLVFMGHIMEKQGVDTVVTKIPYIIKKLPKFKFKIIGDGSYKEELIGLAKSLGVYKYCHFYGRLGDESMRSKIAKCSVAIAPYKDGKDNYSRYADPGKVKTYLSCGVPVLLTDIPWNAKEIEKEKCGLIIKSDGSDLVEKVISLMNSEVNKKFRANAISYSEKYNYEKMFSNLNL